MWKYGTLWKEMLNRNWDKTNNILIHSKYFHISHDKAHFALEFDLNEMYSADWGKKPYQYKQLTYVWVRCLKKKYFKVITNESNKIADKSALKMQWK